jgi:hypothetical protein
MENRRYVPMVVLTPFRDLFGGARDLLDEAKSASQLDGDFWDMGSLTASFQKFGGLCAMVTV